MVNVMTVGSDKPKGVGLKPRQLVHFGDGKFEVCVA